MKFKHNIEAQAGVKDTTGNLGSSGEVLSSTGTGVEWIAQSAISASSDFMFYEVKNSSGATINKGKAVMAVGTDGNSGHILIDEMVADGSVESRYFMGVLETTVANGGLARVIAFGELDQFNTLGQNGETWVNGQVLWCDPDSAGDFTITEPLGPNLKIPAAFIMKAATNGKIQIRVQGNEGVKDLYDTKITTQTDGELLVWDNTTGVWMNDDTAIIDYTNGRVGIGTTSPNKKLHIRNGSSGASNYGVDGLAIETNGNAGLQFMGGTNNQLGTTFSYSGVTEAGYLYYLTGSNSMVFGTNSGERMRIDSAGNVGIGTTSPQSGGGAASWLSLNGTASYSGGVVYTIGSVTKAYSYFESDYLKQQAQGGYGQKFIVDGTNTAMTILSGGNVGIGTTSPSTKLQVYNSTEGQYMEVGAGDGGGRSLVFTSSNNNGSAGALHTINAKSVNGAIALSTAGNERMRITSDGGISFGSTGTAYGTPGQVLTSAGNAPPTWETPTTGDITAVVAGSYLTGGGTSGSVTLNGDNTKLAHIVDSANASVTSGWITVAQANTGRRAGEIYVTDGESGDHSYIRIEWMRSYADSNFTVINCGGHQNRIQGVRVLEQTSDATYGPKYLQVKVTATSNYYVIITAPGTIPNYSDLTVVTPILEDTKTGYSLTGAQLEDLQDSSIGTDEGITVGGDLFVNGGDIVLGGTGRIQGVDTVSVNTDAANKLYVDNAVSGFIDGSGTANYLARWIDTDTLGIGVTYDNGTNVGIGTASPSYKLDVAGSIYSANSGIDGGQIRLKNTGGGSTWYWAARTTGLNLGELAVADGQMFIENGGNVGIGTTSPDSLLNLEGVKNTSIITLGSTTNDASWSVGDKYGAIDFYSADGSGAGAGVKASISYEVEAGTTGSTNSMVFRTAGTTTGTNNVERMRIDSSGNVGIGTTSPGYKLHVAGNSYIDATSASAALTLGRYTGQPTIKAGSDDGGYLIMDSNGGVAALNWYTANNVVLAQGGGNVGIGATSPGEKLTVSGNGRFSNGSAGTLQIKHNYGYQQPNWGIKLDGDTGTTGGYLSQYINLGGFALEQGGTYYGGGPWRTDANSTSYSSINGVNGEIVFYTNASLTANSTFTPSERMRITSGGNVGIGTTSPAYKLHVEGGAVNVTGGTSNAKNIQLYVNDSWGYLTTTAPRFYLDKELRVDTGLIGSYNEDLQLRTAGNTNVTISYSTGNVGIGTTSPAAKLDVVGITNSSGGYSTNNTSRKYFWRINNTSNSGEIWKKIGTYSSDGQSSRIMITATGTSSYSAGTKPGKITIIAQVNNNNLLEGSFWQENMAAQYGSVGFVSNSATSHDIYYQVGSYSEYAFEAIISDGTFTPDSSTVATPTFTRTAAREWNVNTDLNVTSSGNVGIGTTAPTKTLEVAGSGIKLVNAANTHTHLLLDTAAYDYKLGDISTAGGAYFQITSSTNETFIYNSDLILSNNYQVKLTRDNVTSTTTDSCIYVDNAYTGFGNPYNIDSDLSSYFGSRHVGFRYNGTIVGYIGANGTTAVTYSTTSSDERLKKNIEDWQENILDKFEKIEPKKFNFISEEEGESKTRGFIAQKMAEDFPEAYPHDYSEDKYYSFNPSGMVVYLMKAVKDLVEQNKKLETRIQTLEQQKL